MSRMLLNILKLIGEFSYEPFGTIGHLVGPLFSDFQNWSLFDYLIVRGLEGFDLSIVGTFYEILSIPEQF